MLSLFRKFITNSNESSSQVPFVDETFTNKLEIFIFNLSTKEWSDSVSGTIFIEKQQPPKTSLLIIKIDSLPYHLIRKITRDFHLFEKDDRTWMFRVYEKTKSTDYNESTIIACRFSTKTTAIAFNNFIKNLQTLERAGFENLNFRLEIIRKKHEEEIAEKECALSCNFPMWSDLLNGEYYQNFHNKNNDKDAFRCMAEIREFDRNEKKWKKLILGIVKIDVIEDTGQSVLTVIENGENFIRLGITRDDIELIALDNRSWMWRGYKKSQNIQSLLIGCRFINSKIAKTFGISIIKAQEYAPSRCKFRDEYMKETFHKEFQLKLRENQIALECNFPGEYEIIDNDPGDLSFPSTSQIFTNKTNNNKLEEIKNSPISSVSNENSNLQSLLENRVNFYQFDSKLKKWNNSKEGNLRIIRNGETRNISIVMKIEEEEFVCQLARDLELMRKNSRSLMWRVCAKDNLNTIFFFLTEFDSCEKLEVFEKLLNDVKGNYSPELECDQLELETLKSIFENDLETLSQALVVDFPSHVDLAWLSGPNVVKYRAKNISETEFIKGSIFNSKVDIYKFDTTLNEWKKLTALPGSVVVKAKQFQEFQKTILYAISDEFQGTIVVKCEIAGNLNLEMKDKTSCIWRGYVEMDDEKIESLLIACRFANFHTANYFKSIVTDVVQKPLKCYLRHDYLSAILKNRREEILRENQIPLESPVENGENL